MGCHSPAATAAPSEDDDDAPYVPTAIGFARSEGYAAGVRHGESLTAAPSGVSDAPPCPVWLDDPSRAWAAAWEMSAKHHSQPQPDRVEGMVDAELRASEQHMAWQAARIRQLEQAVIDAQRAGIDNANRKDKTP
jgi:hypothetical protein